MLRPIAISALFVLILGLNVAPALAQEGPVPPWREPFPEPRATAEIIVGDTPLTVDLALEPQEQSLGLGYRNGLEQGTGMLFVFPDAEPRTFWMKGMRFCLDIIWIEDQEIVGAAESVCPDPEGTPDAERDRFPSGEAVTHVLEVPAGWLDENGYGEGTDVRIPEDVR